MRDPLEYIAILLAIVGFSILLFTLYLGWNPCLSIGLLILAIILFGLMFYFTREKIGKPMYYEITPKRVKEN